MEKGPKERKLGGSLLLSFSIVERSETKTARYASEIENLKKDISYDIIWVFKPIKISLKGEMSYG